MERIYTIPLRKEFQKAPSYKRSSKAVRAIKKFLIKHMKSENIKLGKYLNQEIWKNGPKNPPSKVKINVTMEKEIVMAELVDAPQTKQEEDKTKETKKETKEVKKENKVPAAAELKEPKEKKDDKKIPTAAELKENKKIGEKNSKK